MFKHSLAETAPMLHSKQSRIIAISSISIFIFVVILIISVSNSKSTHNILIISGDHSFKPGSIETYSWHAENGHLLPMTIDKQFAFVCSKLKNKVLVAGAYNMTLAPQTLIIDAASQSITKASNMKIGRRWAAAATLGETVWVCGGGSTNEYETPYKSCEVFQNSSWSSAKSMNTPRLVPAMVAVEDNLFIMGGVASKGWTGHQKSVEKYSRQTNSWTFVASMHEGRNGHAATEFEGNIIVCGGWWIGHFPMKRRTCEKYMVNENRWVKIAEMRLGRADFALVFVDERLYAVAGKTDNNDALDSLEFYNKKKDTYLSLPSQLAVECSSAALHCQSDVIESTVECCIICPPKSIMPGHIIQHSTVDGKRKVESWL